MKLIAMAIPVFLVMIVIELVVSRAMKRRVYRLSDALTDLGCGVSSQVFWILLAFGVYTWVYEQFRLVEWAEGSAWPWVIGFLGYDLAYYWFHRVSHRVNVVWSAHIVHHQSEDYNLAVALRQAWFQPQFSRWFYLPLALLGIDPVVFAITGGISLLYQFWIHTELVGRMGPLEWIMNTPSHHRVHHGTNPEYLDKNYAAIFIIWDRMFGTFEPERAPVRFGITNPLRSYNVWWANFHYWAEMWHMAKQAQGLDKLKVWFWPPEWKPEGVKAPPLWDGKVKYDPEASAEPSAYVVVQFLVVVPALALVMYFGDVVPITVVIGVGALLVVATLVWGGMFERKAWARPLELVRLAATGVYAYWVVGGYVGPTWAVVVALATTAPFAGWVLVRGSKMSATEPRAAATAA